MSTIHDTSAEVSRCPVPLEERCCCLVLHRVARERSGILSLRYDTAAPGLEVRYDPVQFDPSREDALWDDLAHTLNERRALCRDREQRQLRRGCGYCVQQLLASQRRARRKDQCDSATCPALSLLGDEAVSYRGGVMTISPPRSDSDSTSEPEECPGGKPVEERVFQVNLSPWRDREIPSEDPVGPGDPAMAFSREPLFVAVSLVSLITGAVLERVLSLGAVPTLLAYGVCYAAGGYFGLRAGLETLRNRKIDVDLLMVLAALGAAGIGAPFEGGLLLFLFSLSNVLQDYALDRTKNAIRSLARLRPDCAFLVADPEDPRGQRVPVESVRVGQYIQVRPGERIPLDGMVLKGASGVDQSSVTGESIPVEKGPGDEVLAGTINQDGALILEVRKTSSESTIARVITLVEEARENQAKTERFLERFEQIYALGVIVATLAAASVPILFLAMSWQESVYKAITFMVAASPCALIISTPASILSAIGNGARRGILFKGGVHVEQAGTISVVAFDKTGTLTEGRPRLSDVLSVSELSRQEVLRIAAALEAQSEHVIAAAVVEAARDQGLDIPPVEGFRNEAGIGVRGMVEGVFVQLGSPGSFEDVEIPSWERSRLHERVQELEDQAKTAIVLRTVGDNSRPLGVLAVQDRLRPEAPAVVKELRRAGVSRVVMLTGDNARTAAAISAEAGVDQVYSELMPEDKLAVIHQIQRDLGPVAMVGDGVNDAPALAGARLGIAMGAAGTDVALDTADVVLLSDKLENIPYLIALSRATRRTLVTNLSVALALILMMATAVYTIDLPLPLAVVGHEGGTVLVSLNGLRLLFFRYRR
ncbi:Cd2+/Zn2+-exporting ATPase [Alkalispirochaeta americana]|uniref:Cd2+/Zn2+-exporting ATPase n=1 Tax=Alkalispirochaeta americana TaxID=159291 RepID=A0A1N6UDS2_9SPIO|nr:heavy metal translocating P-type ATPase [Alkalispirochaeta americana]SIQ63723.1 Cd2+/Zn2+-exporting ATPase [Alkalispirochaeta americana]